MKLNHKFIFIANNPLIYSVDLHTFNLFISFLFFGLFLLFINVVSCRLLVVQKTVWFSKLIPFSVYNY